MGVHQDSPAAHGLVVSYNFGDMFLSICWHLAKMLITSPFISQPITTYDTPNFSYFEGISIDAQN